MKSRFWLGPLALGSFGLLSCGPERLTESTTSLETPSFAAVGGTWTTKAPMPTPRANLAAAVQNNSLGQPVLYAIGGFDAGAGPVRTVEAYNFATNTWTNKARLPFAITHSNGVGVIGGKLYLAGGFFTTAGGLTGYHPGLNVYDPVRNSWSKKADMPKRFAQGVSGVINGKLYVLSGRCDNCGSTVTKRLYRYDPATDTWTALPWAPNHHLNGAGGVINGKFYVAGGHEDNGFGSTNTLDVYDPVTNKWKTLTPMPTARYGAAAAVLQNKLYIIGKANADPGEPQNQVEAYDPATNSWTAKTSLPGAGLGDLTAASVTFQGRSHIITVGGADVEGSNPGNVTRVYTP